MQTTNNWYTQKKWKQTKNTSKKTKQLNESEYIKWSIEQVLVYKACKELNMFTVGELKRFAGSLRKLGEENARSSRRLS